MSEIRDWAGGHRTGDVVAYGSVTGTVGGYDCPGNRVPVELPGYGVPQWMLPADLTPVSRKHWRQGDRVCRYDGRVFELLTRCDARCGWYTTGGAFASDEWFAHQPPVLRDDCNADLDMGRDARKAPPPQAFDDDCDAHATPACGECGCSLDGPSYEGGMPCSSRHAAPPRPEPTVPPCASCGEPSVEGCEVNGQPRCWECGVAMSSRGEGRHVTVCWCGGQTTRSPIAAMVAGYGLPRRVCRLHGVTSSVRPDTGPAWERRPEPGDRVRDELLRAIFGGGR